MERRSIMMIMICADLKNLRHQRSIKKLNSIDAAQECPDIHRVSLRSMTDAMIMER
jgi:hypothetical protein